MRLVFSIALVAALALAAAAPAAVPDGPSGPWIDEVVSVAQSRSGDGGAVHPQRSDLGQMLGAAEGTDDQLTAFSLGIRGQVTARFTNTACNGPGPDLQIVETTTEPYPPEEAAIFASNDGTHFVQVTPRLDKDGAVELPAGLANVSHVRVIDVTSPSNGRADGYDVDGIRALHTSGCATAPGSVGAAAGGSGAATQGNAPSGTRTARLVDFSDIARRIKLHRTRLRLSSKGTVAVRVNNPTNVGVFVSTSLRPVRRARARATTVGRGRGQVSVPARSSRVIRVKVSKSGRRLLARRRSTRMVLTLTVRDPSGKRRTLSRRVVVTRSPARR
jgi:hypothetical protein